MIRRALFKIKLTNANDCDLSLLPVMRFSTCKHFRQTKHVTELSSGQAIQRKPIVFRYQFQHKEQVGPSGKVADKKVT